MKLSSDNMFDLPDVLGLSSAASPEKNTNGHHQNGNVLIIKLSTVYILVTKIDYHSEKRVKLKI